MRFTIPIRLPSLLNTRKSWRAMLSLKNKQKRATAVCIRKAQETARLPRVPLLVTITRVGPRKLDDDNLAGAAKYVRDEIARAVGVDDGSTLYTWRYEQRVGKYGVEVEITER